MTAAQYMVNTQTNKWSKYFDKKAASTQHMHGSIVFDRWRQCAPHATHFLGPIQVHNPNSISIGSAIFAQLTEGLYTLQWAAPFPLKIAEYLARNHNANWWQGLVITNKPKWQGITISESECSDNQWTNELPSELKDKHINSTAIYP